jgi:hypothetical protein
MAIMGVMKMAIDQIVDMLAVRHRFMPAAGAMCMLLRMPRALMFRCAIFRVGTRYTDHMFVNMVVMQVVQMAIVQIVDVTVMHDARMPASWTMRMSMIFVLWQNTIGHLCFLPKEYELMYARRSVSQKEQWRISVDAPISFCPPCLNS